MQFRVEESWLAKHLAIRLEHGDLDFLTPARPAVATMPYGPSPYLGFNYLVADFLQNEQQRIVRVGYLPQALGNHAGLYGWTDTHRETFSKRGIMMHTSPDTALEILIDERVVDALSSMHKFIYRDLFHLNNRMRVRIEPAEYASKTSEWPTQRAA